MLSESVDIHVLIEQASQAIINTLRIYIVSELKRWRSHEWHDYCKKHGISVDHSPVEYGFNPDENILNTLAERIPLEGFSPVYGAMTAVSKALTKLVREYIGKKFGDPISMKHGTDTITVSVEKLRVSVWWHPKERQKYSGVFRARSFHANGTETLLEIVVNREHWRDWLIEAFHHEILEWDKPLLILDEFTENIIDIFAHEYAHLEQSIKGGKNYTFSLLPQRNTGRNSSNINALDHLSDLDQIFYFARPAEIDAMATGAAAQVVERLMRYYQLNALGYNWSSQEISDERWNAEIMNLIKQGTKIIPSQTLVLYINNINQQMVKLDPAVKAKFLHRVKSRFLKTYYKRLTSYLRDQG